MTIHHIGYLVPDMKAGLERFSALGYQVQQDVVEDMRRNVAICFISNGAVTLELICPLGDNSALGGMAKKIKQGPYHICYQTATLDASIEELVRQGFILAQKPEPAVAIDSNRVAFLFHKSMGLIELVEAAE